MDTVTHSKKPQSSLHAMRTLVSEFISGRPDPDNPQPPGPWDPVIRKALSRLKDRLGPHPDPWKVFGAWTAGPQPDPWQLVALNPQPLPPRMLFAVTLAEEVVNHVSTLQDVADAVGQSRSTAPEYLARFVDDIELCPPWRKWPFPPPKRGDRLFDPIDLVTLGVSFEHLAQTVPNDELRGSFQAAGAKLAEKGAAQM
jgi:hypothetical protein